MGIIRFREINWDDLKESAPIRMFNQSQVHISIAAFVILAIGGLSLFPIGDLFLSQDELAQKYQRTYVWLNRCDMKCESKINVKFLHRQKICSGLMALYKEEHNTHLLEWRTAIDDRATALECLGFPRERTAIYSDTEVSIQMLQRRKDEVRIEKEERFRDQVAMEVQRYKKSLIDGNIDHLIDNAHLDSNDKNTMVITVSDAWLNQSDVQQKRVARVLWEKWANIHSFKNPEVSVVRLNTSEGKELSQ